MGTRTINSRALRMARNARNKKKTALPPPGLSQGLNLCSADQVDLTRADPACPRCHGDGVVGKRHVRTPSGPAELPCVCACVTQRGGFTPAGLDKFAGQVDAQLLDGTFSRQLTADLQALPIEHRDPAREKLRMRLACPNPIAPEVYAALTAVLSNLDTDPEYLTRPCAPPTLPADAGAGENHVDAPI